MKNSVFNSHECFSSFINFIVVVLCFICSFVNAFHFEYSRHRAELALCVAELKMAFCCASVN